LTHHNIKTMGRFNKTVDGVFVDIVGTEDHISSYDKFINYGNNITPSRELKKYSTQYKNLVKEFTPTLEKLASVEEVVMQLRSRENIDEIKLSLVREYVYARCSFYRRGVQSKDIRVIVDKEEFWEFNKVDDLLNNTEFMEKATNKLTKAMDTEIKENVRTL